MTEVYQVNQSIEVKQRSISIKHYTQLAASHNNDLYQTVPIAQNTFLGHLKPLSI